MSQIENFVRHSHRIQQKMQFKWFVEIIYLLKFRKPSLIEQVLHAINSETQLLRLRYLLQQLFYFPEGTDFKVFMLMSPCRVYLYLGIKAKQIFFEKQLLLHFILNRDCTLPLPLGSRFPPVVCSAADVTLLLFPLLQLTRIFRNAQDIVSSEHNLITLKRLAAY